MNVNQQIWMAIPGEGPVVAAALHDGSLVRPELSAWMALGDNERAREEDPFTAEWTAIGDVRIVGTHSRFEVDLNRPRDRAVYMTPDDAWGLRVWNGELPPEVVARSLARYDAFYAMVHAVLSELQQRYGGFVVYDLHTYNHRRSGPDGPPADPAGNPEVNLGTGTMNRRRWAPLVDGFLAELRGGEVLGRRLDVRENVKFFGGGFPRFVHEQFPESGCVLSVEVKKVFMDEWTGQVDPMHHVAILRALQATVPVVRHALQGILPPRDDREAGA